MFQKDLPPKLCACFFWTPPKKKTTKINTNQHTTYGCFLEWWYPTTMGFPTKNDHFGVFGNIHMEILQNPRNLWWKRQLTSKKGWLSTNNGLGLVTTKAELASKSRLGRGGEWLEVESWVRGDLGAFWARSGWKVRYKTKKNCDAHNIYKIDLIWCIYR